MIDLVVRGADVADTLILILRTSGSTKDLQDVEDAEVDEGTFAGIVHLRSLDHDGVRGQVDTPSERRSTAENLWSSAQRSQYCSGDGRAEQARAHLGHVRLKHALRDVAIGPEHTGVMDTEARVGEILHFSVPARGEIALEALQFAVRLFARDRVDQVENPLGGGLLAEHLRRLDRLLPGVDKHHALMAGLDELGDLVERGVVEVGARLRAARFALDTDKVLLERDGSERRVEEEEAGVAVDAEDDRRSALVPAVRIAALMSSPEEVCNIDIVRQRSRETDNPDQTLRRFDLAQRPRDDRLDDGASVFMQQMNFVDDQELDFLCVYDRLGQ